VNTRALVLSAVVAIVAWGESARADDVEDCVAAAERAQPLIRTKRLVSARAQLETCASLSCPAVVRTDCKRWLDDVSRRTPSIVVSARDSEGREVRAARVLVDGTPVADALDANEIPVDPGERTVRVELASPVSAVEQHVTLREGEKGHAVAVAFPVSTAPPSPPPPAPAPAPENDLKSGAGLPPPAPPPTGEQSSLSPPPSSGSSGAGARVPVTLTLLGLGVLSAGAAVYFGVESKSQANTAGNYASALGPSGCYATTSADCTAWSNAVDAENRDATLSRVLYGAGGGFAVAALATWLLWPRPSSDARAAGWVLEPAVGPDRAGLGAGGRF
jgi:hypothetical protein